MATNLATIRVELLANAQNFKKNIDTAKRSVTNLQKTTQKVTPNQKKLQESFRNLSGSIAAVQGPLGPVAGRISSIGAIIGRVNPLTLLLIGGFTGLGVVLGKFVTAGARAESQLLKLQAILKATGNASGQTAQDLDQLAISIGRNTLASVQGARDAAGVLLTFKSISGDTFGRVLELSQDLAAVGFGSIKTAAVQLGKALEEPEIGLSALRRVGVSFTEQQKEQIKVLSLTGQQAKAQELILKALEEQVGGAGRGAAGGLAGAFDTLGENITLFFEKASAGKAIVSALTTVIQGLANILGKFIPEEEKLPQTIEKVNEALENQKLQLEVLQDEYASLQNSQGRGVVQRKRALKSEIEGIKQTITALEEKKKALSVETITVNKTNKITEEALKKINRERNREIFLLGKSNAEKRAFADLTKLENALISKLGEGAEARRVINGILDQEREKRLKLAEIQQAEIDRFNEISSIAGGVGSAFERLGKTITDAFIDSKTGALDFKAALRALIVDIQKTIIQVLILDRIKKSITGGLEKILIGTATGGVDTSGNNVPPSMRSTGGAISGSKPTLVGERGPELFVPRTAGSIVPSSQTPGAMSSGSPVVINQNLNFALGVTNTVRSEIANLLPSIQQSTISAVADAKLRGGKFSKAFGG